MSAPSRSLREADTKERLDVALAPALDKITYEFLVEGTGEAIAGPFMFGRAFDSPPFFSFSAVAQGKSYGTPELTVGVAEWVRDEQNMYVGANLWVRFKRCFEPHLEGTDHFGGFANINGLGPEGDEVVFRFQHGGTIGTLFVWNSTFLYQEVHDPQIPFGKTNFGDEVEDLHLNSSIFPYNYMQMGASGAASSSNFHKTAWRVSAANPTTSKYHLRMTYPGELFPPFSGHGLSNLFISSLLRCREVVSLESSTHATPVWRINPGDKVTLDWTMMASNLVNQTANGPPITRPDLIIYTKGLFGIARFRPLLAAEAPYELTTAYKDYHAELVAPAAGSFPAFGDAFYLGVDIELSRNTTGPVAETFYDIGNLRVAISGTNDPVIPPSYRVDLNFEGVTLKGYGNIHKIEPRTAPVKVVLVR